MAIISSAGSQSCCQRLPVQRQRAVIARQRFAVTLALDDDLFDAQFVRALAYTAQAGADVGECFATAERITKTDGDLWYEQWFATAERV